MSESEDRNEQDELPADTDKDERPLLPDADAGGTAAEEFATGEKDHGRQDYGP